MARYWTHGAWTVKPGREDEFVAAWREMARVVRAEVQPAGEPQLLRDRDDPQVFGSFGPWDDLETVARFRELVGPHIERIRPLTDAIDVTVNDEVGLQG